jgi:hypothetical protein
MFEKGVVFSAGSFVLNRCCPHWLMAVSPF